MSAKPFSVHKVGASSTPVDVLIVGAGLAGLFLALRLAPRRCTVISPAPIGTASSSAWAQGGLAAALDPTDSPADHARDTVAAGGGLVDPIIAELIATEGPERVYDLLKLGVPFDRTETGALALSLEAAHSRPRVARVAGDLAGKAIMDALVVAARACQTITLIEDVKAISLLQDDQATVCGCLGEASDGRILPIPARHTVLCTGGSGGLFRITTNPPEARGDALAMAYTAGALVADTEFVQFHPTALDVDRDPAPLATEALRGEGAILTNRDGTAFMKRYHENGELAPRDEVARAIHMELRAGRGAFLDARKAVGPAFAEHFPTVFAACLSAGIDPVKEAMPVAPAAHYHMGGIVSDIWGDSSLSGLSVCGECASTGAHGANRLASNSLLEAVVFAHRIAARLKDNHLPDIRPSQGAVAGSLPIAALQTLRRKMTDTCGVVRHGDALLQLIDWISAAERKYGPANSLVAAKMIATGALAREESRGGHFRLDFPSSHSPQRTFLSAGHKPDRQVEEAALC